MIQHTTEDPTPNRPPDEVLNDDIVDQRSSQSEGDVKDQDWDIITLTVPLSNQERLFPSSELMPFDDSNLLPVDDFEDVNAVSFCENLLEEPPDEPDANRDEDSRIVSFSQFDELDDDSDTDIPT
jgi:hypothetical protein